MAAARGAFALPEKIETDFNIARLTARTGARTHRRVRATGSSRASGV
jgi:hypothetical protein